MPFRWSGTQDKRVSPGCRIFLVIEMISSLRLTTLRPVNTFNGLSAAIRNLETVFEVSGRIHETPFVFPLFPWLIEGDFPWLVEGREPDICN